MFDAPQSMLKKQVNRAQMLWLEYTVATSMLHLMLINGNNESFQSAEGFGLQANADKPNVQCAPLQVMQEQRVPKYTHIRTADHCPQ
jgi:hypothetical protein